MDRDKLNNTGYKKYRCFSTLMREVDIVDYLLYIDSTLDHTYDIYQDLLSAIQHKDYETLLDILDRSTDTISTFMSTSIQTLRKYKDYIKNTFTYSYTNGRIEGTNNLIKVIKRIAFG